MRLPRKMSDLLELAVTDARKCQADKRYRLNMYTFHSKSWSRNDKCDVCLAGAVIAQTLRAPVGEDRLPSDYSARNANALAAIDNMRSGYFAGAAENLGVSLTSSEQRACHAAMLRIRAFISHESGRAPWRAYLAAVKILREGNL